MDDPVSEIATAITLCAAAATPDAQIAAFRTYCHAETSFLHPFCHVPRGPGSLEKVIEVYQFYRSVIAATEFEVLSTAFDREAGQVFVRLIQRPRLRWAPGWIPVELPMLICFRVVQEEDGGKWVIRSIEDFVQPMVSLFGLFFFFFGFPLFGQRMVNLSLETDLMLTRSIFGSPCSICCRPRRSAGGSACSYTSSFSSEVAIWGKFFYFRHRRTRHHNTRAEN
jgi:hypothetical protein